MGGAVEAFLGAAAQRFRAYAERLAHSLGHADRQEPLRGYLTCSYSQFRMLRKHWSFAPTALSWPPCLRSCLQWFLWSLSGFGVEPLWNWR
jgi:hypothetical protein